MYDCLSHEALLAYKFTGKERDTESGLDNFGARYMGSSFGRFMSPDAKIPSVKHLVNPQKWNKYSYVLNNPLALFDPNGLEEVTIQFRAFIPQASVAGFKGDNRGFSADSKASSRVSVTVRIETDPAKNHGHPLIGMPEVVVGPTHPITGGERTSNGPQLPAITAGQDKNGNVTVNIQESMANPYTKNVDPDATIKANVSITVNENATNAQFSGTISGSPSFEGNLSAGGENQNVPLQSAPDNFLQFISGLHNTNTIDKSVDIPKDPQPQGDNQQ